MKKKLLAMACAAFAALVSVAAPTMHPYDLPSTASSRDQAMGCLKADEIVRAGGKLELGKWYTDFTTCKKYCDDNGIPLFAVWSNAGCVHCWYTDICFTDAKFKEWAATHDAGKVIYCFMAGGEKGCPDQSGSSAYNWMWYGGGSKLSAYPFVVLWWQKGGINYRTTGDNLCKYANGSQPKNFMTESSVPERVDNIAEKMSAQFKNWHPEPEVTYAGGYFTQTNYPYASPEAEETTKSVSVEIVRDSLLETNQAMTVSAPGKAAETMTVSWTKGQKSQTVSLANFNTKWFAKGKDVTLALKDGDTVMSTLKIACVAKENSADNPKWIGKSFDFGEWTMDFDAAKKMVKGTGGSAYTLVSVQGSQWCPDCGKVEANFLGLKDASGNNRFAAWAKSKNIALVAIDIPNFTSADVEAASPCLLKKDAYETYVSGTKEWHSGLGYLTRNEISDADAAAALERNHYLASKNTYEGGFHRPEDTRVYRTGVPIFVLLRKDGTVAARLTRFADVSPTAEEGKANFDNYIKRFEEMLTIADNNATEIENNYASASNELTLKANGGTEEATISHTDTMDVFRLEGVGGNALQSIKVTGACTDNVIVSLLTTNAEGKAELLATSGAKKLSGGIELEHTFEKAGSYFVKVAVADITSASFRIESAESTFQPYTVKGSVVLVPQEDKATAKPPAGSDKLTVKLTAGTKYFITGMESCAALEAVAEAPAGFYVATQDGNAEMTLTQVDGEVSYQVWNAGTVCFEKPQDTIPESYCDFDEEPYEIIVQRQDGKSGAVKMTVTVDALQTTLSAERYYLHETNAVGAVEVEWADGEIGEKIVKLQIDDAQGVYDGTQKVVLTATVDSQAGDVSIIEGRGSFCLYITEDDKQSPGTVYVTGADPVFAGKSTVYARETEGAKLWTTRVDGSDGLVAATLTSTIGSTQFATANPRDLDKLSEVAPALAEKFPAYKDMPTLCWSNGESGEKYVQVTGIPAGKTAKVTLRPIDTLEGIAASNTVTIISVADDAPAFLSDFEEIQRIRYVDQNPVEIGVTNLVEGGVVSFSKLSGTLPAGLKVGFVRTGDTTGSMTISGAPTAKAGTYELVYQVIEKRGSKTVPGLTTRLSLTVIDPITGDDPEVPAPVPEMRKSRTFKNVPVLADDYSRLLGLLQVTIPPTGRVSAKFTGIDGTVSYSSKSWSGWGLFGDSWTLQAALASNKGEAVTMGLEAKSDGSFAAQLSYTDAEGNTKSGIAESDGKIWSSSASAADWADYYTVALKHNKVLSEDAEGVAPTGDGIMTLKMNSKSAINKGTFTVAGYLPTGTKFSGSFVLTLDEGNAYLPICKTSSKDALTAFVSIAPNAKAKEIRRCVETPTLKTGVTPCLAYWRHTESASAKGSYEVDFLACGSYYDASEIGECCEKSYETTEFTLYMDEIVGAHVTVKDNEISVDPDWNPLLVTLSLNRSTGIVTGKSNHTGLGIRASYAGVIVNGWGEGCGCGPGGEITLPLMSGSYFYKDDGLVKGGNACIDKSEELEQ